MKKVLVIAYYYPPLLDVGTQRTHRFVRHMRKFGWEPHVLTVKNPDRHYCITGGANHRGEYPVTRAFSLLNYSYLLGIFEKLIEIVERRIPIVKLKHSLWEALAIPDRLSGWLLTAYLHGIRILRRNQYHLIYVSVNPFGAAIVAKKLSQKFNIPFIVDARDPMTCTIYKGQEPQTPRQRFEYRHEAEIIRTCARFVLTTHTAKEMYRNHYANLRDKFDAVYNGYDATDDIRVPKLESGNLNIVYVGNYYFDPSPILKALKELRIDDPSIGKNVIFRHIGLGGENISKIAATMGIEDAVQVLGHRSRSEMMAYVRASDVFFVRTQLPTNISAKLFDGLAVNIPILVTYAHSEIRALVERYASKYTLLHDESTHHLKAAIKKHYLEDRDSGPKNMNYKFLQDFSGVNLTRKMCLIFDDAVGRGDHNMHKNGGL